MGSDKDPKSLVSELEAAGAARLEKRNGYPYNYTVLIVNDDHPDVQDVHEESAQESTSNTSETATEAPPAHDEDPPPHDEYEMDEPIESPTAPASTVGTENGSESGSLDDSERD
jgi:hypothetical protein